MATLGLRVPEFMVYLGAFRRDGVSWLLVLSRTLKTHHVGVAGCMNLWTECLASRFRPQGFGAHLVCRSLLRGVYPRCKGSKFSGNFHIEGA